MRDKLIPLLYYCLALVAITGCCKVYCVDVELGVDFSRMKATDTDTVLFLGYKKGSNFQERIDSIAIITQVAETDTTRSGLFHTLSFSKDWKVVIPAIQKEYYITDFIVKNENCSCGGNDYSVIRYFKVNGEEKEGINYKVE